MPIMKNMKNIPLLALAALIVSCGSNEPTEQTSQIFFDDFSYQDMAGFNQNGWQARTGKGHPGDKRAHWDEKGISFHPAEAPENSFVRLSATIKGDIDNTAQAQICYQRKFREGTYAARVLFSDEPAQGPDGDQIIETFYTISPLESPMDPDYSELDFEYLANGGWKHDRALWVTSWETFQHDPWTMKNQHGLKEESYAGWRTLVIQAMNNEVKYFVDGKEFFTHDEEVYPEAPMSINFNLWFVKNGLIDSDETRIYQQDVDWVFFEKNVALTTEEISGKVAQMRTNKQVYSDTVPAWQPPLESPCSL